VESLLSNKGAMDISFKDSINRIIIENEPIIHAYPNKGTK